MLPLGAPDMLTIWERGCTRHPIDRALLLLAAACPEIPADRVADVPLGRRNAALLRLRQSTFGSEIPAYIDCTGCGERMELALDTDMFLPPGRSAAADDEFEAGGFRLRSPTSRDLVAILDQADADAAAVCLLDRCCIARPRDESAPSLHHMLETIEAGLESLDPGADIKLLLTCESCGHAWVAPFDIAAVLWDEVDARARALLATVHTLARAYGWTEREVLALSEQRCAAYLSMVMA